MRDYFGHNYIHLWTELVIYLNCIPSQHDLLKRHFVMIFFFNNSEGLSPHFDISQKRLTP
jgi:hypothetical protein